MPRDVTRLGCVHQQQQVRVVHSQDTDRDQDTASFPSPPSNNPAPQTTMGSALSSCCSPRRKNAYEPLLLETEREAVADLLQYLESQYCVPLQPSLLLN